tara:strand:+ start:29934 stop:30920 length:987 start_codon:yes stop_codon:yes gene_type:complete
MMLPPTIIKEYLYAKFPDNRAIGEEFTTNSIFTTDSKKHLSINMESGLWQDFKSHETGNFPQLVAYVEEIPYDAALLFLRSKLFDSPENLFDISSIHESSQQPVRKNTINEIFSSFQKFDPYKIDEDNLSERLARTFVISRKLTKFEFYISTRGRYTNRIIIPYMYKGKDPFFFQARNLSLLGVKYLNPSKDVTGVKSSDILYPFRDDSDYIFLTEGPVDAMSLQVNGLNATCTQGSMLSHAQANQIKDKQIIFAYDNDEAGRKGIRQARKLMLHKNVKEFCVAKLPETVKDWNELHVRCGTKNDFRKFVVDGLAEVDFEFEVNQRLR